LEKLWEESGYNYEMKENNELREIRGILCSFPPMAIKIIRINV